MNLPVQWCWQGSENKARLPHPWDSPGKNTEWVAISFSNARKLKVKGNLLCHVRNLAWTAAYQAPPSMGFSRQEYWSGMPLPSLKCSPGISNFLEEISSLSYSVVFLYFFVLITEEGFLISSCCSLQLCIKWIYLSFSPLLFTSIVFTAICKASSDRHFAFLHFFSMGIVLIPVSCIMSQTSFHSSSGTLSDLGP